MGTHTRRRFVRGTAAVAATGALAGCNGNGNGNENGNGDDAAPEDPAEAAENFLNEHDANQYDGLVDRTGEDEITIDNGAGPNGFAFDPAGVRIDAGTTVTWEWTGEGGAHNVVSEPDSDFDLETELVDEEGFTYEVTFDEPGAALYVCTAHRAQNQYGAVVVE
ncbi:halocyanin [Natronomonas pharaonis DSM 2160]|uniref:Halocyanin n=1 Tax=Natronomonas pharaonis (strain ATCC 35678 / DSM 2160 / CIP 103997 / JCM 8858 / NBRC 14720 / NCIMB 2260 / Gabara) TaxID=348780 RepID=A0A1U7EYZ4_NATPD|nr:halocyanin domain-containing protein [Natronomonas pharaonis]CAI50463.1 halocyanin [Natronomonas pharaonis DSM 2160]